MGFLITIFKILPNKTQLFLRDYQRRKRSIKAYDPSVVKNPVFQSSISALDYYKCIFVHIPKNAGISVSYTLFGNTGGSHRKIKDYMKIFSPNTFKKYYKFTFVRNPWDRLVSTYFFLKNGGLTEKDKIWADANLATYKSFKDFVENWLNEENIKKSLHFQQQYVFLENEKGMIAVDFIGRFENIDEDFRKITQVLKIDRKLGKRNVSKRDADYRKYYNNKTRAIVASVYNKDIELFNYKF